MINTDPQDEIRDNTPSWHEPGSNRLPLVSVIVPSRNRVRYLGQLLKALTWQAYPPDRFEVIVVDNESEDGTKDAVTRAAQHTEIPIRYFWKQDRGPAAARNVGASLAKGSVLAFTDSDCIPHPGWIRHAVGAFQPSVGVVCGPIIPIELPAQTGLFTHQIHEIQHEDGLYATANVFFRRRFFEQHNGFDEGFGAYAWGQPVGGDDTDLAWRVKRAGHESRFVPGAKVYHQATPTSMQAYMLQTVAAQVIPRMVRVVPELREMCLWNGYFLHIRSAAFYGVPIGLGLSPLSVWFLLLLLPWLALTLSDLKGELRTRMGWLRIPVRLALEFESSALLMLSLLYSSIRNGRLVL